MDLIAFVDIHLQTYQVKVLGAKKTNKKTDIEIIKNLKFLLDNIVLNHLLLVSELVQYVTYDDLINKIFYFLHHKQVFLIMILLNLMLQYEYLNL
jgi:hypothetical protein